MVPSYNNAKPDCGYTSILKPKCRITALKMIGSNPVIAINIPSDVMTIITTADVGLKSELVERGF
jgi:hypothetical protein